MKVSIIGYGAFGRLWADILSPDFEVVVTGGSDYEMRSLENGHRAVSIEEALMCDVIFYSVPISQFEPTIRSHSLLLSQRNDSPLVIDLLSVKIHPLQVCQTYLPSGVRFLLMHPMFGPMSVIKNGGISGLHMVLSEASESASADRIFWENYFTQKGACVHTMSADDHDRYTARTQAVTHYIAQLLNGIDIQHSPIDTASARDLISAVLSLKSDSGRLFDDMLTYNPHVAPMIASLQTSQLLLASKYTTTLNHDRESATS